MAVIPGSCHEPHFHSLVSAVYSQLSHTSWCERGSPDFQASHLILFDVGGRVWARCALHTRSLYIESLLSTLWCAYQCTRKFLASLSSRGRTYVSVSPHSATACFESTSWLGTWRLGRLLLLTLLAVSERWRPAPLKLWCDCPYPTGIS